MIQLLLKTHSVHPWVRKDGLRIRGWYEYQGALYNDHIPGDAWKNRNTPEEVSALLTEMNGNFGLLLETDTRLFAVVDRITSYPLYYTRDADNNFCISDSLQSIKKIRPCVIDEPAREELLACGYVLGRNTIYKDVYQLQGGQMLVYDKKSDTCAIQDYFLHTHRQVSRESPEELCRRLDETVLRVFQRMIDSIQGKTVALFLSGGYDSKLVATTLKRLNYTNVICVTLGGRSTKDAVVGQQIARQLGYPLVKVKADKAYWREQRAAGAMDDYFNMRAAHCAMPYIQGRILKNLIRDGLVPQDCVAVTGNSGDAVEGNDVTHFFFPGNRYSGSDIAEAIRFRHFMLNGLKESKKLLARFDLTPYASICGKKDRFSDEEAEEIVEYFNWRERQCKFVVNDVRNYDDGMGIEWRLPLWDNEFVDFWLTVPYLLRYDRRLYYQYVRHEKLPSANELTLLRKQINALKKVLKGAINPLYIPKALWDYSINTKFYYAPFGLLTFPEMCKILRTNKGNRDPHLEGVVRLFVEHL